MENKALINGKIVELSDTEKSRAEEFHKNRVPFIFINNKLYFNAKENDDRDHNHWVKEDFGVTDEEFENLNRGYLKPGRIQLFKGSSFGLAELSEISIEDMEVIVNTYINKFGTGNVNIYNGVHVGKVGDIWEPIQTVFRLVL